MKTLYTIAIFVIAAATVSAQNLPKGATILERVSLSKSREMILWMQNPTKHPRDASEDIYTCPDRTRGHHYSGNAFVTLVNRKRKKNINTVAIAPGSGTISVKSGNAAIDLPYLIERHYYTVPKLNKNKEGKPVLMDLKDYNNDGKANEFALFDAVACMGLETTLIGYSEKQDKVIHYPIELKTEKETYNDFWVDYLFGQKPNKKGIWKYEIDYRGRGGALEKYEFRYDKVKEKFSGKRLSIFDEDQ